jgi:hypothetical protein
MPRIIARFPCVDGSSRLAERNDGGVLAPDISPVFDSHIAWRYWNRRDAGACRGLQAWRNMDHTMTTTRLTALLLAAALCCGPAPADSGLSR